MEYWIKKDEQSILKEHSIFFISPILHYSNIPVLKGVTDGFQGMDESFGEGGCPDV